MSADVSLRCNAILFDLDGVLVDSGECVDTVWREWAARHGLDAEAVMALAQGHRTIETVRVVAPHLSIEDEVAALEIAESTTARGVYEVEGARQLLGALPAERWAVVTSGSRPVATFRLKHCGLPVPAVLISADDVTRGKPEPEGYLAAAARLGVSPTECVVIEDTPTGLAAARAAGMRSIAICGTYPREALTMADHVVARLGAVRVTQRDGALEVRLSQA